MFAATPLPALNTPEAVHVRGTLRPGYESILTREALAFVADLARLVRDRVDALLQARVEAQNRYDRGQLPDFDPATAAIREGDWVVDPLPADLLDRRVEITGPVDRKMVINALNSGANVYMADFEDSTAPTWDNVIQGQINLRDAVRRTITFQAKGKHYALNDQTATLFVRPRGWHLTEAHLLVDGRPIPGGLLDFGLYFFHNARELLARGTGPYFYLPKLQHAREAAVWNDVFLRAQALLGISPGTIKATVLLETLPAAFQMHEILHALRQHSAGLNCGRWDYIFSFIKTHRAHADKVLPDRGQIGMTAPCMAAYTSLVIQTCHRRGVHAMGGMAAQIPIKADPEANQAALDKVRADPRHVMPDRSHITMDKGFLRAYVELLIQTCHRRGVHAMGGMAAQIPIRTDPEANEKALEKVRQDKLREVKAGHDGTWVAHPGLVPVAKEIFDAHMEGPNQIDRKREDVHITADDLLRVPEGTITEDGLRINIDVGIQYVAAWLGGLGCVPIYNLMEDAATAEISRIQVWQWLKHGAKLDDGRTVTADLVRKTIPEELAKIKKHVGDDRYASGHFEEASELFQEMMTGANFPEFLTLVAYEHID